MSDLDELDPRELQRAQAGDSSAFTTLVRRYDRRLRTLAFGLLGDRDRMDDVLQDVYVKAFRALSRFRSDARLSTWLHRITYHACIDELRRSGRRPLPFDPLADDATGRPATDGGPERSVVDRLAIDEALAALPPDQRAAVLLVDGEGLDYITCGEVLGIPPGTVASRLSRARASLRAALRVEEDR
jgi:RNA polymerase sigma-70 factor (ECF subfamily)